MAWMGTKGGLDGCAGHELSQDATGGKKDFSGGGAQREASHLTSRSRKSIMYFEIE
jgi:hypothetical protein